jgi:hypothetical protein
MYKGIVKAPIRGKLIQTLKSSYRVICIASLQNNTLASGGFSRFITIWDTKTGLILRTLDTKLKNSIHFNSTINITSYYLNDENTTKSDPVKNEDFDEVNFLKELPDGTLASALSSGQSNDHIIQIWNPLSGTLLLTLKGHTGVVRALELTNDGRFLASGSMDKTVRLWNSSTGELVETLAIKNTNDVNNCLIMNMIILFEHLAVSCRDQSELVVIATNDITNGFEVTRRISCGELCFIRNVVVLEAGENLMVVVEENSMDTWQKRVGVWNVSSGERLIEFNEYYESPILSTQLLADGSLAGGMQNGMVLIWNVTSGEELHRFKAEVEPIYSMVMLSGHSLVTVSSYSYYKKINIWG